MEDQVSVNLNNTKFKLIERSRGRMKIQIKFSKEEAEGFKNFCMIKPEELADEMFYKQIFFAGCNTMTEQIQAMMKEREAELDKLEKQEAATPKTKPKKKSSETPVTGSKDASAKE
jgi:fructose-specific phosphotransferase system component IIB|tara:strand:+ start:1043 stop:1390 length:348 start_codon:yes stop_codon:yes gene_type:complete